MAIHSYMAFERIRQAVTKHGRYSKQAIAERKFYRALMQECRETLEAIYQS